MEAVVVTTYTYGMGLISQHEEKRGTEYYHYDNLGSTTYLTKNGVKTETFAYGTYGELLLGESGTTRFLYNGRFGVATDDNNLYYMRARYYNVDIKRFINQDIITGEIANSQSLNRYAYCQGNPVNYMDPFGLSPQNIFSAAGHAILNVLGMMPGGEVFDLVNAIWYAIEGNWTEAMICLVGAVPLLGTFAEAHNLTKLSKGLKFASNAGKMYIGGAGAKQNLDNIYDMLASGTGEWYDYLREGGAFVLNVFTCAGGTVGVMDGLNDAVRQMQKASTENLAKEIANNTVVRDLDVDLPMNGDEWEAYFKYKYGDEDVIRSTSKSEKGNIETDFYVTPAGDVIPANKETFEYNLSLMENIDGKYVGDGFMGPVRIRIEGPHPLDEKFNGDLESDHFIEHIHIEHRKNGISGPWGKGWKNKTTIPLSWIYGDD